MVSAQGQLVDLSPRVDYPILHLYSPETEHEESQILCEIDVFITEHGLPKAHTIKRPSTCQQFLNMVDNFLTDHKSAPSKSKLTFITWGHGNRVDDKSGYFKVFSAPNQFEHLMLDDILLRLSKWSQNSQRGVQLLMTQCWAHCHSHAIHSDSQYLTVDWLSSRESPETSARRWDNLESGKEMSQDVFEDFLNQQSNYDRVYKLTTRKYKDCRQKIFLKYLHFSSVHVEATYYVYSQRLHNK